MLWLLFQLSSPETNMRFFFYSCIYKTDEEKKTLSAVVVAYILIKSTMQPENVMATNSKWQIGSNERSARTLCCIRNLNNISTLEFCRFICVHLFICRVHFQLESFLHNELKQIGACKLRPSINAQTVYVFGSLICVSAASIVQSLSVFFAIFLHTAWQWCRC